MSCSAAVQSAVFEQASEALEAVAATLEDVRDPDPTQAPLTSVYLELQSEVAGRGRARQEKGQLVTLFACSEIVHVEEELTKRAKFAPAVLVRVTRD